MSDQKEIEDLIQRGNEFFLHEQYDHAKEKYKEALTLDPDPEQKKLIETQIQGCNPAVPAVVKNSVAVKEKIELTPEKKKWFDNMGFKKLNIGADLMKMVAKKLIPKLKPMIEKNKPQLISFMRGEIDMKGQPVVGTPQRRIIIVELAEDPSGDRSKDDVIAQFKRSDFVRVQVARDKETGEDLSHEVQHSIMALLDMVMSAKMEDVMEEMEKQNL